jgi:hypothetical protein
VLLLLSAIVSVLLGFVGVPLEFCDCTVIIVEQLPAATVTGEVVNANWVAPAGGLIGIPTTVQGEPVGHVQSKVGLVALS